MLRTQCGDIVALGEIFTPLFSEQTLFGTLVGVSPEQMDEARQRYRQEWDNWVESADQASQTTFQLSGQQLVDLQRDPARFQQYIDSLLARSDGQQKVTMAGNQLSALQVQEVRQLRELMATQVQSQLASQMKEGKESQMPQETQRETTKTNRIGKVKAKPDPF